MDGTQEIAEMERGLEGRVISAPLSAELAYEAYKRGRSDLLGILLRLAERRDRCVYIEELEVIDFLLKEDVSHG
jgi:hypothetical protein